MAQLSVNHVSYAFVAKDIPRQATSITNPASPTYIKEGEVVVAGIDGKLLTSDTSTFTNVEKVKIAQLKDSGLFSTPPIDYKNVQFYKVTAFANKTEKVIYIGWNGTGNSLEGNSLVPATEYQINVRRLGLLDHYEDSYSTHKLFSWYNEDLTTGEHELARGLVKNGVDNFYNEIDGFVKIEMVTECAASAAGSAVEFIEGSKVAIATNAGHNISACDFIKVNGEATYYVKNVDGTTIELEVPYQGVSCTITPRIVNNPTSGAWGLKLSGNPKKFTTDGKFTYDVSDFDITLVNFKKTTVTYHQSANLGNGTWQEVAQLEWEVQDYEGQTSHTDWQMPVRKRYFEEGKEYDILIIRAYDDSTEQITGNPKSPFTVYVAIPTGNTQGDSTGTSTRASGVAVALDNWLTANTGKTYNEAANLT